MQLLGPVYRAYQQPASFGRRLSTSFSINCALKNQYLAIFVLMRSISNQAMEPPFTQPMPSARIDTVTAAVAPIVSP